MVKCLKAHGSSQSLDLNTDFLTTIPLFILFGSFAGILLSDFRPDLKVWFFFWWGEGYSILHLYMKRQNQSSKNISNLPSWPSTHLSEHSPRLSCLKEHTHTHAHTGAHTYMCVHSQALFYVGFYGSAPHLLQKPEKWLTIILPPTLQSLDWDCDLYLPGYGVHVTTWNLYFF